MAKTSFNNENSEKKSVEPKNSNAYYTNKFYGTRAVVVVLYFKIPLYFGKCSL